METKVPPQKRLKWIRVIYKDGDKMIVDSLNNSKLYENLHNDFQKVFEVLKEISQGKINDKTVLVENSVWINPPSEVKETTQPKVFEAHKDYIDIHYIISGEEEFGYSNIDRLKSVKEYDAVSDYELLDGDKDFITLKAGDFCIVFPQDAHIPANQNIGTDKLIRIVAKIKI